MQPPLSCQRFLFPRLRQPGCSPVPPYLRSPLLVRVKNVIFCLYSRMARVPAVVAAPLRRERVGRLRSAASSWTCGFWRGTEPFPVGSRLSGLNLTIRTNLVNELIPNPPAMDVMLPYAVPEKRSPEVLPAIVTAKYCIVIHAFKWHFSLTAYPATAQTNANTSGPELAITCSAYPT
jgi:hypothetical protein